MDIHLSFLVVTGATDGIGKAYAEEVRILIVWSCPDPWQDVKQQALSLHLVLTCTCGDWGLLCCFPQVASWKSNLFSLILFVTSSVFNTHLVLQFLLLTFFSYCNYFHLPQALEFSSGISRHWLSGISSYLHCVPIIPYGFLSLWSLGFMSIPSTVLLLLMCMWVPHMVLQYIVLREKVPVSMGQLSLWAQRT